MAIQEQGKQYLGTNPSLDNANPAMDVNGVKLPDNMKFNAQARSGNDLFQKISALLTKAEAGTFAVEDQCEWQVAMRELGIALQNTSIDGFRGVANGTGTPHANSIATQLATAFAI